MSTASSEGAAEFDRSYHLHAGTPCYNISYMLVESAPRRLSHNQWVVLRVLREAATPLSAYSILDRVEGSTVTAPTQVYRALKGLASMGLVGRVESLKAFVARDCDVRSEKVGYLICPSCNRVNELDISNLSGEIARCAELHGFMIERATIEAFGWCAECQFKRF